MLSALKVTQAVYNMATELIDGNTLRKVRNMLKTKREGIVRDSACPGLAIRAYKSGVASWAIVARDWRATLGPLDEYAAEDVPLLRELVVRARALKAEGRDPEPLLAAFRKERDVRLASDRADVAHGIGETWEDVRDAFLAWVLEHRNRDTHRGYRSALGAVSGGGLEDDFEPLHGKPVASITTRDLARVRSSIVRRGDGGKLRQADLTVSALKSCFAWYVNRDDAMIEVSPADTLSKVMERPKETLDLSPDEGRVLTQDEIGLLILGFETERNATARLASALQLATGQRRMTACSARRSQFVEHPDYGLVWRLSQDKAKAWRVLPLPPFARQAVESARMLAVEDNAFLFPQQRPRRAGASMDGHISERRVSQVIEDMRRPGGTLTGLPFAPATHDVRRTFVTVMGPRMSRHRVGDRQLAPTDVKMITHADEGRVGTASLIYDKSEYLDVKFAILSEWEQYCLEGYYRARERSKPAA